MIVPNIIEYLREKSVKKCFELSAFTDGWVTWKSEIQNITGGVFDEKSLFDLGDNLSEIFLSTRSSGRGQSLVSGGGYGWEGLVCWYLNLCFCGSRAVAVKKLSDLPEPLRDAISVNYGSFRSNTESDITVIVFPDKQEFLIDKSTISVNDSKGDVIKNDLKGRFNANQIINRLADNYFDQFEVGIIQCKTNWNDNAQIPMLWSMIYEATFDKSSISIGRNGYSIQDIQFSYSFCTVPTNKLSGFKTTSTSVQRVRNLTGGNYWGRETISGVSSSIKEIFNRNFKTAFGKANQRMILKTVLEDFNGDLSYFDIK